MTEARAPVRMPWLLATVVAVRAETHRARLVTLDVAGWAGHRPGQHLDVRLVDPEGYVAQRSYSIAGPADGSRLQLLVERLDDGEVSPYLVDVVEVGDVVEVRGPVGGWFVWEEAFGGPLLLVGGGSGVVPLRAMLLAAAGSGVAVRLVYGARTEADLLFRSELDGLADSGAVSVAYALSRLPAGAAVPAHALAGRVDSGVLTEPGFCPADRPKVYICGSARFVGAVSDQLVALGHAEEGIRTERFGPSS